MILFVRSDLTSQVPGMFCKIFPTRYESDGNINSRSFIVSDQESEDLAQTSDEDSISIYQESETDIEHYESEMEQLEFDDEPQLTEAIPKEPQRVNRPVENTIAITLEDFSKKLAHLKMNAGIRKYLEFALKLRFENVQYRLDISQYYRTLQSFEHKLELNRDIDSFQFACSLDDCCSSFSDDGFAFLSFFHGPKLKDTIKVDNNLTIIDSGGLRRKVSHVANCKFGIVHQGVPISLYLAFADKIEVFKTKNGSQRYKTFCEKKLLKLLYEKVKIIFNELGISDNNVMNSLEANQIASKTSSGIFSTMGRAIAAEDSGFFFKRLQELLKKDVGKVYMILEAKKTQHIFKGPKAFEALKKTFSFLNWNHACPDDILLDIGQELRVWKLKKSRPEISASLKENDILQSKSLNDKTIYLGEEKRSLYFSIQNLRKDYSEKGYSNQESSVQPFGGLVDIADFKGRGLVATQEILKRISYHPTLISFFRSKIMFAKEIDAKKLNLNSIDKKIDDISAALKSMMDTSGTLRDEIRISKRTFQAKADLVEKTFCEFSNGFYWIPTKVMHEYLETRLRAFQAFNDDLGNWKLNRKDRELLEQYIASEILGIISCSEFGKLKVPLNLHTNYGVRIPGFLDFMNREFRKVLIDESESEQDSSSSESDQSSSSKKISKKKRPCESKPKSKKATTREKGRVNSQKQDKKRKSLDGGSPKSGSSKFQPTRKKHKTIEATKVCYSLCLTYRANQIKQSQRMGRIQTLRLKYFIKRAI